MEEHTHFVWISVSLKLDRDETGELTRRENIARIEKLPIAYGLWAKKGFIQSPLLLYKLSALSALSVLFVLLWRCIFQKHQN